jgi:hypothetical protein
MKEPNYKLFWILFAAYSLGTLAAAVGGLLWIGSMP